MPDLCSLHQHMPCVSEPVALLSSKSARMYAHPPPPPIRLSHCRWEACICDSASHEKDISRGDWRELCRDLQIMHPRTIKHRAAAGGDNEYLVERVRLQSLGLGASAYSMPPVRMLPADTAFEQGPEQAQAQCWWTSSGHLLLHPAIDGQRLGWMLLDTGVSQYPTAFEMLHPHELSACAFSNHFSTH